MMDKKMAAGALVEHAAGRSDLAGVIVPDGADDSKAFATLAAQFAMAGHSLVRASDGSLLAIRWGMFKPLADTGEALRFLKLIGGAA